MNESTDILLSRVLANENKNGNRKSQEWNICDIGVTVCTFTKEFQKLSTDSSAAYCLLLLHRVYFCVKTWNFLGDVTELRNVTFSFVVSVRPSIRPATSMEQLDPRERIFVKFYTSIFQKSVVKIQISLNSDKNKGYFT